MTTSIDHELTAALVRDVVAGDEAAFARLVAAYHRDLIRCAYVVCGDADLAEDAVQATWAVAWRKLDVVRDPTKVRSWLMAVAANEARQGIRRRRRRSVREIAVDDESPELAGLSSPAPDRSAAIDLRAVLDRLPDHDRRLIAMRYAGGLTSAEIAESIGMSPGGVRVRLSRLLDRLRRELGDD